MKKVPGAWPLPSGVDRRLKRVVFTNRRTVLSCLMPFAMQFYKQDTLYKCNVYYQHFPHRFLRSRLEVTNKAADRALICRVWSSTCRGSPQDTADKFQGFCVLAPQIQQTLRISGVQIPGSAVIRK